MKYSAFPRTTVLPTSSIENQSFVSCPRFHVDIAEQRQQADGYYNDIEAGNEWGKTRFIKKSWNM